MDIKNILSRNEIPVEYKWSTEDIYSTDEEFLKDLNAFKEIIKKAESFNNVATTSAKALLDYYNFYSENMIIIDKLNYYSMLKSDEDTSISRYQDFRNQMLSAYYEYVGAISFFSPQLLSLSEECLEQYYIEEPDLLF